MRLFIIAVAILIGMYLFMGSGKSAPETVTGNGEPMVSVHPTIEATPTPVPTATPAPLTHGEAQRMQFDVGTYGGSYSAGTWVLWAAHGQTLTLTGGDGMRWLFTVPDGDVPGVGDTTIVLPASGDYTLTVAGVDQFSIDIR